MSSLRTIRSLIPFLGPTWLTRETFTIDGEEVETDNRLLWSIGRYLDASLQRLELAFRARLPGGGAPEDALPYIGRDRQIIRGPAESRESYEVRLQRALDDWQIAGSPWALMEQLRAFCSPHSVLVRTVDNHGNWYVLERDGTRGNGGLPIKGTAWDWDAQPTQWSRFWVLISMTLDATQQPYQRAPVWGASGKTWGATGATWGSTATPEDVHGIRKIVRTWKPDGTRCPNILVVFESELSAHTFDPTETAPPLPDGTWGPWSQNSSGTQVRTRAEAAIYLDGTS